MLQYWNSLAMHVRSSLATILQSLLLPAIQPRRIPVRVKASPGYHVPDASRERAYSRIHPPSTTQL